MGFSPSPSLICLCLSTSVCRPSVACELHVARARSPFRFRFDYDGRSRLKGPSFSWLRWFFTSGGHLRRILLRPRHVGRRNMWWGPFSSSRECECHGLFVLGFLARMSSRIRFCAWGCALDELRVDACNSLVPIAPCKGLLGRCYFHLNYAVMCFRSFLCDLQVSMLNCIVSVVYFSFPCRRGCIGVWRISQSAIFLRFLFLVVFGTWAFVVRLLWPICSCVTFSRGSSILIWGILQFLLDAYELCCAGTMMNRRSLRLK